MDAWEGAQAKLDRTDAHLATLDVEISAYLDKAPYRFVGEETFDADARHQRVFLEVVTYPPDEMWGPIIGDVVHNMRSALDHLAWGLALPERRAEKPRGIEFPVLFTRAKTRSTASSAISDPTHAI